MEVINDKTPIKFNTGSPISVKPLESCSKIDKWIQHMYNIESICCYLIFIPYLVKYEVVLNQINKEFVKTNNIDMEIKKYNDSIKEDKRKKKLKRSYSTYSESNSNSGEITLHSTPTSIKNPSLIIDDAQNDKDELEEMMLFEMSNMKIALIKKRDYFITKELFEKAKSYIIAHALNFYINENVTIGTGTTSDVFLGYSSSGDLFMAKLFKMDKNTYNVGNDKFETNAMRHELYVRSHMENSMQKLTLEEKQKLKTFKKSPFAKGYVIHLPSKLKAKYCHCGLEVEYGTIPNVKNFKIRHDFKSYRKIFCFIYDILGDIEYIHALGIYHMDVKVDNTVFINGHFKLIDFSLSLYKDKIKKEEIDWTGCFSPNVYCLYPEEMLENQISEKTDVFSLGMSILIYFFNEDLSFYVKPETRNDFFKRVDKRIAGIKTIHNALGEVLERMVKRKPIYRYTATQLLNNFFF
jgi:serine/threonine protein kinase